jgi:hypothetical protein
MFQLVKFFNLILGEVSYKRILFIALGFFMLVFVPHFSLEAQSDQKSSLPPGEYASFQPEGDIRRFVGEVLYFDISFLWFKNAATAKVGFYEKDGKYFSYMEAKTKGFVGFFTAYRQHIYQANFDIVDGGRRVRANTFLRKVIEGGNVVKAEHFFDYSQREHRWVQHQNEEMIEVNKEEIPPGVNFDDVLTAFYNIRNGVYGPVGKGNHYTIKTIPEKGNGEILVHVREIEEEIKVRKEQGKKLGNELLIDLLVPKEIFSTESGRIRFWSSKHLIPTESTIKDYILLGDLHAVLSKRESQPQGVPVRPPSISFAPVSD